MSISGVFPSAQHVLLTVQHEVNQYESCADRSPALAESISGHLDALLRQLTEMEALVALEGPRREMWRSRVRAMSEEVGQLRATFSRVQQSQQRKAQEDSVRSQLMGGARRRVDTNVSSAASTSTHRPCRRSAAQHCPASPPLLTPLRCASAVRCC